MDPRFLREEHRGWYGRPWVLGQYQMDFLLEQGLKRHHSLLDFGCGAGRLGVNAAFYMDDGNYYGVDTNAEALAAFSSYEVPVRGYAQRARRTPHLALELSKFDRLPDFDFIVDFFATNDYGPEKLRLHLERLLGLLSPGGKLLRSPSGGPSLQRQDGEEWFVPMVVRQPVSVFEGTPWQSSIDWDVYQ